MLLPTFVLIVGRLLAAPTVTSLDPAAATAGAAGFTLTVTGSDFRRNSVVLWNGAERPTTWLGESRLQAVIGAADIAAPGTVQVRVRARGAKGGESEPVAFTVAAGATASAAAAPANNPVPSLASLAPTLVAAGGESFRLLVSGAGFASGVSLRWNGTARPTTRTSSTALFALIDRSDIAAVGTGRVSILNPAPGGGSSTELAVRIVHLAPVVASLSPASAPAGSGDLTMTLTGQNFIRTAQAYWNNAPRPTTFVGPLTLRIAVPASDLARSGTAQVTVVTTVDQSAMRSAPVAFTVAIPPQTTVSATPQLVLDRFYVGGETNPARVTAGQAAPLSARITGVSPTHWRAGENAQLTGAEWRAASGAPTWTFPTGTTGTRTLYYQTRYGDGTSATLSNIVSDAVEVVPPYSTAGVTSEAYGSTGGTRVRLECAAGQVMTGVHGASGLWLDNVGIYCAGEKGPSAYFAVYGGLATPELFEQSCPFASAPIEIGLYKAPVWNTALGQPTVACEYLPPTIGRYFPVADAEAIGGVRGTFEDGVHCPDPAFPVGLDVWLVGTATGGKAVSALGLVCARLRS